MIINNSFSFQNTILNKLSQLENIKNKHLARTFELKRQTHHPTAVAVNHIEQKDLINSLFSSPSSSPKSIGLMSMDHNNPSTPSTCYQHQRNSPSIYRPSSLQFDAAQTPISYHDSPSRLKTPDEFFTPPSFSSSSYIPVNNNSLSVHSYMNVSFQETTHNSPTIAPSSFNHHSTTYPY
jgi:hypothetical protein